MPTDCCQHARDTAGERFTGADVQIAGNIAYVMSQNRLPEKKAFSDYSTRTIRRPAVLGTQARDKALAMTVPALAEMFGAR